MNQTTNPGVQTHKKRLGLLHARVGTAHRVTGDDKVERLLSVKDVSQRKGGREGLTLRCLTCGAEAFDLDELAAAHPPAAQMVKQESSHVWAYWAAEGLKDFTVDKPMDFNELQGRIASAKSDYDRSPGGLFADEVVG
jgi:hypothetical protein